MLKWLKNYLADRRAVKAAKKEFMKIWKTKELILRQDLRCARGDHKFYEYKHFPGGNWFFVEIYERCRCCSHQRFLRSKINYD